MPLSIVATDTSPEVIHHGQLYRGIRCGCSGRGHYLLVLPLTEKEIADIGRAPWGGRGGRKYGPSGALWYVSANPACRVPGTGLRPCTDGDENGPKPVRLTDADRSVLARLALGWTPPDEAAPPATSAPSRVPPAHTSLPLAPEDLRRSILECQHCFSEEGRCVHHEDLVGGYKQDAIVVVGINPQTHPDNAHYRRFEQSSNELKLSFGDHALDWLAGRPIERVFDEEFYCQHDGLNNWLPRVAELLSVTTSELADHFVFVESFKHATSDLGSLDALDNAATIKAQCPRQWLLPQLERLAPRLVLFCGNAGADVARVLFPASSLPPGRITDLHGAGPFQVPDLGAYATFCIAFSRRTRALWSRGGDDDTGPTRGTSALRQLVRDAIEMRPMTSAKESHV